MLLQGAARNARPLSSGVRQEYEMDKKLENLWKLHDSAWASFKRRADHEFKFSVAVWSAAAALVALGLKVDIHPPLSIPCAILLVVVFVFLHLWYECGMAKSNNTDLNKCYSLEATILEKIDHKWPGDLQDNIDWHKNKGRIKKNWSHFVHIVITAVLASIAAFLLCTGSNQSAGKNDRTIQTSTGGYKMELWGSNLQELKTFLEDAPQQPTGEYGSGAVTPQGISDGPNKTNAPDASGAR